MSAEGATVHPQEGQVVSLIKALNHTNLQYETIIALIHTLINSPATIPNSQIEAQLSPLLLSILQCYVECMHTIGIIDTVAYTTEIAVLAKSNKLIKQTIDKQNELFNLYLKVLEDLTNSQSKQGYQNCKTEVLPTDINLIDVRTEGIVNLGNILESTEFTIVMLIRHFY